MKMMIRHILKKYLITFWIVYLLLVYLLINLYVHVVFNSLAFHPPESSYTDTSNIIKLNTKDGARISAIYLPNPNATFTVLINHGNADDLGKIAWFLNEFHNQGFSIFAYDYHGFGTSEGSPTEANVYMDSDAAYSYLVNQLHVSPQHIIVYGRSLGSGVAVEFTIHHAVAALILESPFVSAFRTATQFQLLLFDKFNNLAKINQVKVPVLIIHGKLDRIIPAWQGEKLFQQANQPKMFYWVENAGHNDVAFLGGANYWSAINKFVANFVKP